VSAPCEHPDGCQARAIWRVAVGSRSSDAQLSCRRHMSQACQAMAEAEFPRAAVVLSVMAVRQGDEGRCVTGTAPRGRAVTTEQKQAVLALVLEAWQAQPRQRLGQLLASWACATWAAGDSGIAGSRSALDGLQFTEDGDLAHGLLLWVTRNKAGEQP
jgi:hypothetical protein